MGTTNPTYNGGLLQHFTWPNTSMTSLIGGTTYPEGVITIIIQNIKSFVVTFL